MQRSGHSRPYQAEPTELCLRSIPVLNPGWASLPLALHPGPPPLHPGPPPRMWPSTLAALAFYPFPSTPGPLIPGIQPLALYSGPTPGPNQPP
eukprot:161212-Chlamydomonas_euryale.AAC.1